MHGKANGHKVNWIWRGRTQDHPLSVQHKRNRKRELERQQLIVARMVIVVAGVLDSGHPTRFRYEGFCRHALRCGFILEEHLSWRLADFLADMICQRALRNVGAARPSWYQAQPEHDRDRLHSRTFCAHCEKLIERQTLAAAMYCSEECRLRAKSKRAYVEHREENVAYAAAKRATDRAKGEQRTCEWCARGFLALDYSGKKPQRFCSLTCRSRFASSCAASWRPHRIRSWKTGQFVRSE